MASLPLVACSIGLAAIVGARVAREAAKDGAPKQLIETPYAPSPRAAAFVSLGYREALADLLWVRLTGYFGGDENTGEGVAGLVEAIVTLDPDFQRVYDWGALATTAAHHDVDTRSYLRAVAVLDKAAKRYPDDWRYPGLAAEIYTQDLVTIDPTNKASYEEAGALRADTACHHNGAPKSFCELMIFEHTQQGKVRIAVEEIKSELLATTDEKVVRRLTEKLKELEPLDTAAAQTQLLAQGHAFTTQWQRERPDLPPLMFALVGSPLSPAFSLRDTAGQDIFGSQPVAEPLPPPDGP